MCILRCSGLNYGKWLQSNIQIWQHTQINHSSIPWCFFLILKQSLYIKILLLQLHLIWLILTCKHPWPLQRHGVMPIMHGVTLAPVHLVAVVKVKEIRRSLMNAWKMVEFIVIWWAWVDSRNVDGHTLIYLVVSFPDVVLRYEVLNALNLFKFLLLLQRYVDAKIRQKVLWAIGIEHVQVLLRIYEFL